MLYLIGQIALTIFFTALIGITIGWLLRGLGTSRQIDAVEARWRARVAQLQPRSGGTIVTAETGTERNAAADATIHSKTDAKRDAAAARQIAALQEQIRQRDNQLASLRAAPTVNRQPPANTKDLAARLQETTARYAQLQKHIAEQRGSDDRLKTQIEQVVTQRDTLVERLRDRESEIGRMSQERQHAINTIASLQKEMRRMRGERAATASAPGTPPTDVEKRREPTLAASPDRPAPTGVETARITDKTAMAPVTRPPDVTQPQIPASDSGSERQQSLPIADSPEPAAKPRYEPKWRLKSPQGPNDNLQAIFGIGPKLETQLNRLGIFHFEQIGRFERDDILWVAHHLKSFPGRIVRDRWIEQAQTLANQKRD